MSIDYVKIAEEAAPMATEVTKAMLEHGQGLTFGHIAMALASAIRSVTDTIAADKGEDTGKESSLRLWEGVEALLQLFPDGTSAKLPKQQ